MLDYYLILLLSHLLTDFVFQTDSMVNRKYGTGKDKAFAIILNGKKGLGSGAFTC